MSFKTRMYSIVGDENTVARYLLEKVGHTAGIALVFYIWLPLLYACIGAAVFYVLLCKFWGHVMQHHPVDSWFRMFKDWVFDTFVCLLVVVPAIAKVDLLYGIIALTVWVVVFLILDNNRMGEPS